MSDSDSVEGLNYEVKKEETGHIFGDELGDFKSYLWRADSGMEVAGPGGPGGENNS